MLLYDGDCAFCERSVTWLAAQSATTARATTWQRVDLADFDLSEHDCRRAVQWVDAETGSRTSGAFALRSYVGQGRSIARVIAAIVVNPLTRPVVERLYLLVAANRHRLGSPSCTLAASANRDP